MDLSSMTNLVFFTGVLGSRLNPTIRQQLTKKRLKKTSIRTQDLMCYST